MSLPLVSIIMPTYNCAAVLPRAVESLLAQSLSDVEIVVVDDGSTDETVGVVGQYTGRVTLLRQANAGPSAARNLGLRMARGSLVGFLDADDAYAPGKLARQAAALTRNPACGWAYCDCWLEEVTGRRVLASERFGYANRKTLEGWLFEALLPGNFIPIHTLLIRRSLLDAAGHFDERFRGLEDFDLLLRLAALSPAAYVPEPLATYFLRPGSLSANRAQIDRDKYLILDKVVRRYADRIPGLGIEARRAVADMHNWFGYGHLKAGERAAACARFWASFRLCPVQRGACVSLVRALVRLGRPGRRTPAGAPRTEQAEFHLNQGEISPDRLDPAAPHPLTSPHLVQGDRRHES